VVEFEWVLVDAFDGVGEAGDAAAEVLLLVELE
jgi:hypothetical protein